MRKHTFMENSLRSSNPEIGCPTTWFTGQGLGNINLDELIGGDRFQTTKKAVIKKIKEVKQMVHTGKK